RAMAIGAWGAVFGLSMALGPVVGGALVDAISWRAVFFVNVPIGLAAILLTALYVPESRAERPRRLDPVGQLLVIAGLGFLTFAGIGGFLFLNTLYLQVVRGLSPLHAGLYMLPTAAMIAICAPISGRIVGHRGPRLPIVVAAVAIIAGSLMLTRISASTSF